MHRAPPTPLPRLRPPAFPLLAALSWSTAALVGCGGATGDDGTGGGAQTDGTGGTSSSGAGGAQPAGSGGAVALGGSGGTTAAETGGSGAGSGGRAGMGGAPAGAGGSAPATGGAGSGGRAGTGGTPGAGGSTRPVAGLPEYWVGPKGLDSNPGTQALPFQSLNQAHTYAAAGSTIWVMPGTYMAVAIVGLTKSGTATNPMKITAMPGARPLFDFSLQPRGQSSLRAINLSGDYWSIKGIDIANAADNCIYISGSHNTIDNVAVHGCGDTGIQIAVDSNQASDATRGAYNTILNCDSYDNADTATGGENADGFAAKLYIGPGNVFRGCRAFNNSDDGWDFFAANDIVVVDGCWAFNNGQTSSGFRGPDGDGNGFKLGGKPDSGDANMGGAVHRVTNSFGFDNLGCGFTKNSNPSTPSVSMCGGRNNPKGDFCSLSPTGNVTITMTGAQAKAAQRNAADGSLPAIR